MALEMVPGRDALPIDARSGVQMPASTAAAMVLTPSAVPPARRRPYGAAVDDQDMFLGMTCYAVPVCLPGRRRVSLQIATTAQQPADRFAALIHRAALALERRIFAL
ncbi:hypothetical protein [Streptomyces aurantiacus]|uniref:hypothetical protein n=1 Tax=Streptomyces aurantiacus TaxID=47760 RepID=UPI000A99863F|nr:hypothetical protein [Streptomyces aurantiacus]